MLQRRGLASWAITSVLRLSFFIIDWIKIFGKVELQSEKKERCLSSVCSLRKWLHQPGYTGSRSDTRSFFWVFHKNSRTQTVGPFSGAFPGTIVGSQTRSGGARLEPVPIWDVDTAGSSLMHHVFYLLLSLPPEFVLQIAVSHKEQVLAPVDPSTGESGEGAGLSILWEKHKFSEMH